jgi:hypothetical protein
MLLSVLFMLLLLACGRHNPVNEPETGELPISMNLQPAVLHGFNVSLVRVTITKGSFTETQDLTISGSMAEGTFAELELGTYAIDVDVFDGFTLIATGHGTGTVQPAQNTTVYITLQFIPGGLDIVINWGLPYEESRRVLMLGNSHTYYNGGVDTHLQAMLGAVHPEWGTVVEAYYPGGYTLENHFNDPTSISTINGGDWDLVILQEMSSRPMDDPDLFYQYATELNTVINHAGALTGFYMTWAWRNNPEMFVPTRDAYNYIGAYLDALVVPAGVSFYNCTASYPQLDLYAADNYHPSPWGTYLVTCTMLAGIWNINPVGNPYHPVEISDSDALILQNVAWNTVLTYRTQAREGRVNVSPHHNLPEPAFEPMVVNF